jgi:hypothetical protein
MGYTGRHADGLMTKQLPRQPRERGLAAGRPPPI